MLDLHTRPATTTTNVKASINFILIDTASDAEKWIDSRTLRSVKGDMFTETALIHPDAAEYIIANHTIKNRPIRARRVVAVAETLEQGMWKLTSQGISFDVDGMLNNGHHRLLGVVKADLPMMTRVTWGEDRAVFDVLDTGANRSSGDVLNLAGLANSTTIAAAIRLMAYVKNGTQNLRNDQVVKLLESHPKMPNAALIGVRISKQFKASNAAVTFALHEISAGKSGSWLDDFVAVLEDGSMLEPNSPIKMLREGLYEGRFGKSYSPLNQRVAVAGCIIKAWNAWFTETPVGLLRHRQHDEFPSVK